VKDHACAFVVKGVPNRFITSGSYENTHRRKATSLDPIKVKDNACAFSVKGLSE